MDTCTLELRNLKKAYPGTLALSDFSTVMRGGNVYALLGKNGSGKSTLVKCICGAEQPTSGQIILNGREISFASPVDASDAGIAIVYQELSLVLDLTVAENVFLGRYRHKGPWGGVIDWKATNEQAESLLRTLNIDIPVTEKVANLSVGQRQMIEIAKAMSFKPKVLILDEPTSALAQHEVESLFKVIRTSKEQGVIVIFITHKLNEIQGLADFVTVLRDSKLVDTISISEASPQRIVELMFGEVRKRSRPADMVVSDKVSLEVAHLCRTGAFDDVSFQLHEGEILGIAGMLGSGRSELLRAIFGADPVSSGEVRIKGRTLTQPDIRTMKDLGLGMTPENRKEEGLVQILSIRDNLCFASLASISKFGFLNKRMQKPSVDKMIGKLEIKVPGEDFAVSSLSGGNQQKVVVGNWLNTDPSIMFFDEPSRGIDVMAKQQIFQIMWDLSRQGLSIIFVSTELEELLEVCHRVLIMKNGKIGEEVSTENTGLDKLYALCMEA
jgi:ribose transport system ATP-binding protein